MNTSVTKAKLSAEKALAYIFNKLRNHDQIIKFLHDIKGEGWRKMKYARGLFDRTLGFISSNDETKEFIALTVPFHTVNKTCNADLYASCKDNISLADKAELFKSSDILIFLGDADENDIHISADLINSIKESALIVIMSDNISYDSEALAARLESGDINAIIPEGTALAEKFGNQPNVMVSI